MISSGIRFRKKLTAMNMLVSGGALLLASLAFFAYDLFTFRTNLITNTSIQAQIIGSNAVSPLIFNDRNPLESTLSALRASQHIIYAGIYTAKGDFFAGYWREQPPAPLAFAPFHDQSEARLFWFESGQFSSGRKRLFFRASRSALSTSSRTSAPSTIGLRIYAHHSARDFGGFVDRGTARFATFAAR